MADNAHGDQTVTPAEFERAQRFWSDFTKFTTYSVLGVVALLVVMAVVLV